MKYLLIVQATDEALEAFQDVELEQILGGKLRALGRPRRPDLLRRRRTAP